MDIAVAENRRRNSADENNDQCNLPWVTLMAGWVKAAIHELIYNSYTGGTGRLDRLILAGLWPWEDLINWALPIN